MSNIILRWEMVFTNNGFRINCSDISDLQNDDIEDRLIIYSEILQIIPLFDQKILFFKTCKLLQVVPGNYKCPGLVPRRLYYLAPDYTGADNS